MNQVYTPSRFDRDAAGFDAVPARVELARAVADAIANALPLNDRMTIMDYGAGTGLVSLRLRPLVGSVVAADSSREMLSVLQAKLTAAHIDKVHTRELNLELQPATPAEFDVIVSSMTLHHVRDTTAILRQFHHALKPSGWLAIADLDTEEGLFHRDPAGVHHCGFDRSTLCGLLAASGFVNAQTQDAHEVTKPGADGTPRTFSIFLATAQKKA